MSSQRTRSRSNKSTKPTIVVRKAEVLPFSGRDGDQLVRLVAVTIFFTLCFFVAAHFVKNVTNKINETHNMSVTLLKSSSVTNSAIGTLIDSNEEVIKSIENLPKPADNEAVTKEIRQLNENVNKLKGAVYKRYKKKTSYNHDKHYPVIGHVMNGHR